MPSRGAWTVGLDAVVGVLAAVLLLRRSDWRGWPGLVTGAFALGGLVGTRLLEAHAAATGSVSTLAAPLLVMSMAAVAVAAHFDYVRAVRRAPPMDAAERVSPLPPLIPYAALTLAGYALLMLHEGSFMDPAGLIAWVVCLSAALLFARQAIATTRMVAIHSGLATRSAEARFNALIRNTADVIAIVSPDATITYVTPAAERIFGFSAQELVGQRLDRLVVFDDRTRVREFLAHDLAQPGAAATMEARVPREGRPPARGRDPRDQHGRRARDRRPAPEPARRDRSQGRGGAAEAHGAARSADAAGEPLAVPGPHRARGRGQQAERPRHRSHVHRPRQLQAHQ
jgi:PAS domain S-box-containing protein